MYFKRKKSLWWLVGVGELVERRKEEPAERISLSVMKKMEERRMVKDKGLKREKERIMKEERREEIYKNFQYGFHQSFRNWNKFNNKSRNLDDPFHLINGEFILKSSILHSPFEYLKFLLTLHNTSKRDKVNKFAIEIFYLIWWNQV